MENAHCTINVKHSTFKTYLLFNVVLDGSLKYVDNFQNSYTLSIVINYFYDRFN